MNNLGENEAGRLLSGIRVLDFTHALAGPYATMFLGDLGADVIKVEHPRRGDGTRHMGRPVLEDGRSDYFLSLNRNKRSLGAHLKDPDDLELIKEILADCDVLIHNFRPGVMERLGLGYEDARGIRPDLVYVSVSGFGEDGPMAEKGANDITIQAMSGLMSTTGERGGAPVRLGTSLVDMTTGMYAFGGVLGALYHRERTGEGQKVHVPMMSSAISLLANYVPGVLGEGDEIEPAGRGHAQLVPYQAFETKEGAYVIVGAFTQAFWLRYCEAIGREDLTEDERFTTNADRLKHRDILVPLLEEEMRSRTREEWLDALNALDVPTAPVHTVAESLRLPVVEHLGAVRELTDGSESTWAVGLPVTFSASGEAASAMPPKLGEHTEEISAAYAKVRSATK